MAVQRQSFSKGAFDANINKFYGGARNVLVKFLEFLSAQNIIFSLFCFFFENFQAAQKILDNIRSLSEADLGFSRGGSANFQKKV